MAQFKNINGKRYFRSLQQMGKEYARKKAAEYRKRGMLARAVYNYDTGYYDVFTVGRK